MARPSKTVANRGVLTLEDGSTRVAAAVWDTDANGYRLLGMDHGRPRVPLYDGKVFPTIASIREIVKFKLTQTN